MTLGASPNTIITLKMNSHQTFVYLLLQERPGWRGLLGCALILAGMAVGEIGVFKNELPSSKRE